MSHFFIGSLTHRIIDPVMKRKTGVLCFLFVSFRLSFCNTPVGVLEQKCASSNFRSSHGFVFEHLVRLSRIPVFLLPSAHPAPLCHHHATQQVLPLRFMDIKWPSSPGARIRCYLYVCPQAPGGGAAQLPMFDPPLDQDASTARLLGLGPQDFLCILHLA